ncbi:MAG: L-erythro-3,5-diaminohexanoate dehydrogenase [bacterium ADurb.Bin157]|mgnify:CR=1 FL=1|jgi:L-erythro-3,5-diaminohexanoate dehydrogenase|nr:L-erythro-3,5-diaminohexanoate dehydrogenase [Candidatus Riflebacteria bacterium]MDD3376373.1 L-erythro-3,5-diaminohexanoate dehydrogenase [Candidatus Riflebacteria bacterium]NLV93829.1 L-erythro-3,5-diaminohexanoate dehydrogenase [Candidatus Riflebacteria bacterium]OQB46134.1 MAG: L-erythro-3,5-diaminohexanoate dehydrogenase [bacterium ADurb.Bin157]
MALKGNKYGTHRVIEPKGVLTQAAYKIDNDMTKRYSNEIICDVISLNIDSASFTQIEEACDKDPKKIGEMIMGIVAERGKQQNPVTGSGGMFIGKVAYIGEDLVNTCGLKVGDKIASLVSLSLTPLKINKIKEIHMDIDRVDIEGQAVLFESGIYAKLPDDMSEALALAALDVAGAPAQARKLPKKGDSVLVLGANGKSGVLCGYEAMKAVGPTGNVVGVVRNPAQVAGLMELGVFNKVVVASATAPVAVLEEALKANDGKEYDVSISCVNVESCEMSAILPVRENGIVYFFSMATSFTKAALGAEGIGKDVTMIVGNGYAKDHAEITLNVLRENDKLRRLFDEKYV